MVCHFILCIHLFVVFNPPPPPLPACLIIISRSLPSVINVSYLRIINKYQSITPAPLQIFNKMLKWQPSYSPRKRESKVRRTEAAGGSFWLVLK